MSISLDIWGSIFTIRHRKPSSRVIIITGNLSSHFKNLSLREKKKLLKKKKNLLTAARYSLYCFIPQSSDLSGTIGLW